MATKLVSSSPFEVVLAMADPYSKNPELVYPLEALKLAGVMLPEVVSTERVRVVLLLTMLLLLATLYVTAVIFVSDRVTI